MGLPSTYCSTDLNNTRWPAQALKHSCESVLVPSEDQADEGAVWAEETMGQVLWLQALPPQLHSFLPTDGGFKSNSITALISVFITFLKFLT